ncbi:putative cytochrome P450, partial [Tanacetum coccineum]
MITFWSWWWEFDNQKDEIARTILVISIPTIVVLLWYKWMLINNTKGKNGLPPSPYGLPVAGLQLGCKLHVVVNSVDLVKVVTRERDHTFANRTPPITVLEVTYGGGRSKSSEMKDYSRFEDEFREVEYKIMALLVAPNIFDFLPMLSWFDL